MSFCRLTDIGKVCWADQLDILFAIIAGITIVIIFLYGAKKLGGRT